MPLKRRILIGYGVAFALMATVIAWAVANLVSLGRASDAILRENYRSILAAGNMVEALDRQDNAILLSLLEGTEAGLAQARAQDAVFLEWLARAKDNITIPGEAELVQDIERGYAEYRRLATGTPQSYRERATPVLSQVREKCLELRDLNERTMYAASARAGLVARRAIWSTVAVAAGALLLGLAFSAFVADRIVRPLARIVEAVRRVSAGDYAVAVPTTTDDELGLLGREFNRMAGCLGHYRELNIEEIIAERNKGEAILSSIADGLTVLDPELRIVDINPAARKFLGLASIPGSGLRCEDVPALQPAVGAIRETIRTGVQPEIPDEHRILQLGDGEKPRHFLFSSTAIRGRDRSITGAVLLLRDVTRLKEIERLKSEFVMAASHELRTPLTSLGMSVDLLTERVAPGLADRDRQLVEAAQEEVSRMKALVGSLLDLSRIEAGRIELEFAPVAATTLFRHVQGVFREQAEMKGVGIAMEELGPLPPVRADANKITWVLTNLVSNALRYSREGGAIRLAAQVAGPFVHLSVHDDGPGIPEAYQASIFEKFVQVGGRESGGSGLGLAICKEIVRAHGGTIWVESPPGQGSTFIFTLPVCS